MLRVKLIAPLSPAELLTLQEMSRHHPFGDFRFRARGVIALNDHLQPRVIAAVLGVTEQSVYYWAKWWKQRGLVGLLGGHKGGRPPNLTQEMVDTACEVVTSEALTLKAIRHRVRARYPHAKNFSVWRLGSRLRERRMSFKRCRLSLKCKRDEQAFDEKKIVIEKLKVVAKAGAIDLYFFDEAGMATVPNVQSAWSPIGKPHCADASAPRKRVSILGALNHAANTLIHEVHETTVKRPQVIEFINQLAIRPTADGRPKIVVLDNASIHHNIDEQILHKWLCDHRLILVYLTPYSPELNPIEIVWKQAKYHWRKFITWTKGNLVHEVNEIFNGYGETFKINFA
jgi:transposase